MLYGILGSSLNRKSKKVQLLLQWKCHFKIEICHQLSVWWLFHFSHAVRNKQSILSLDWNYNLLNIAENDRFSAMGCLLVQTSNLIISCCCLADYNKKLHQKRCLTIIVFPCWSNHGYDLWCCCCHWRHGFVKPPMCLLMWMYGNIHKN